MISSSEISYYIISLGCSKNMVDSEKINGSMLSAGYVRSDTAEDAGLIIINTCGFILPAKEESISEIFSAVELKENSHKNRNADFQTRIAVVGCLTSRYYDDVAKQIPEIDFVYGIPDGDFVKKMSSAFNIDIEKKTSFDQQPLEQGLAYTYIKISEGCSNNCSYCAIPLIRGPYLPFSPESIISDARRAVEQGARELILVAQDSAVYNFNGYGISDLVKDISKIRGIGWIRILYSHPDHITDDFIKTVRDIPNVVKYIDIPFQHASGRILKMMGRRGDFETYLSLIERLRSEIPNLRIRSTFMVGFPGESDDDFKELVEFLKKAKLDRVGAFMYSEEEGTAAAEFKNSVPDMVKKRRHDRLMKLQRDISIKKLRSMIGTELYALVEEKLDEKTYLCRTEYDAPEVDGFFYLTSPDAKIRNIMRVRVTDSIEYDLFGEPV